MSAYPFTLSNIGDKTFRIPLYQRRYAWEDIQVRELLQDLYDEGFNMAPNSHYYIGILSIAKIPDDENRYDLIDGQQRITTLLLIGKAASKLYPKSSDWNKFLTQKWLYLYGRKEDQEYLESGVITRGCNPKMIAAVELAVKFLNSLNEEGSKFSQYIYEHSAFFLAEVPIGYSLEEKNQQFVRMNNRGKQLEKHEILKVQLIRTISEENERDNALATWNDMVSSLTGIDAAKEDPTKDKDLKSILDITVNGVKENRKESFYTSIVTIPEFLLIALARYHQRNGKAAISHNIDKLIETFSKKLPDGGDVIKFMALLKKQVEILKKYFIFVCKIGGYVLAYSKDSSFGSEDESNGETKHLVAIQSFLYVSGQPHNWLIMAFDWCSQLSDKDDKVSAGQFTKKLEEIANSIIPVPIPQLEQMIYRAFVNYWFYRLDYELWKQFHVAESSAYWGKLSENKQVKKLVQEFHFRQCGSVEHIIPQHKRYPQSNTEPDHSFGNLALISRSANSKFSDGGIEDKKNLILASDYTESLKMLHFLWCNPDPASAGKQMYEILRNAVGN